MSLAPLFDAMPPIPLHAFAAMAAFVLGGAQLAAPKGTLPNRTLGWIWVLLMALVAVSSLWIHHIRLVGPWSPIHLLSIFTLVMLPFGVWCAHRRLYRRACHRGAVHLRSRADHAHGLAWFRSDPKPGFSGRFSPALATRHSARFRRPAVNAVAAGARNADMDDDIPF
jgi:uncharacterized membrane protein